MTLLYCVFSCLQTYIMMGIGLIGELRGILRPIVNRQITSLLLMLIIPIYFIIQLAKVVDMVIMKTFWILVLNTTVALAVGYCLSILAHIIFKMDVRIKQSFAAMNMVPALGLFPIVIAKGFCYPSGPIEDDPRCNDFLGIVMLCLLVFNISVYLIAFLLFTMDKNLSNEITGMLEICWHKLIKQFYHKNFTVYYLFEKYIGKEKSFEEKFENFEKDNELPDDNEKSNIEYYEKAFKIVDDNLIPEKKDEYNKKKEKILSDLKLFPQKLPYTRSVKVNKDVYNYLKENWNNVESRLISIDKNYKFKPEVTTLSLSFYLNKAIAPPIMSIIIGIIMVVSKTRLILFNKESLYWLNITDGLTILINTYTPLLFCLLGSLCKNANTDNSFLITSKQHVIVILTIKFILLPFIGMFYIYMWREYYGGMIKSSVAYRLIMFSNWCLPSPPNMTLIINILKFFSDEFGYLIFISTIACIIGLTLLHLIYFVIVGLD